MLLRIGRRARALSSLMRSVIIAAVAASTLVSLAHAGPFERGQREHARVRDAFDAHLGEVEREFGAARAAWPPRGVFLRAFKREGQLELWAEPEGGKPDAPRVLVRTYAICAASGVLGPKRREGDLQVPEGFYVIDRFNPRSSYHLSLGVDYPNAVDRARAGDDPPGGDIFIHGECVTVGCLPLENGPIEALYVTTVLARDRGQKQIPVHMFPCRFGDKACTAALKSDDPDLTSFWAVLAKGHGEFERTRIPPRYVATETGYVLKP